ncbi:MULTISPECIES: hypothetical protein [Bacillaceae]|uniref:Lipoprotein n=1 Tax=Domibacillus aminovorans TaxID=29332 RepID=A0A177KGM2_9BACI|nr:MULTISPECIES: hypothetical protein [Bacillaceae]OAH52550.1 hypothetical protein AWH48_14205 [Domibacillus aminovorans]
MKKFYSVSASFALMVLIAAGCGTDESEQPVRDNQTDTIEEHARTMPEKLDNVVGTLKELKASIEDPDNVREIQQAGTVLEEHWDLVEKEIEEQYPDDYENIEESLYPLIAEAKKDEPDVEKMKTLIDETNGKITEFLEKAEKPKRSPQKSY